MKPALVLGSLLAASFAAGQTAAVNPALPGWLTPYQGAAAVTSVSSALIESSYTAAAKPGDVSEYYGKLFAAKGVAFHADSDGLGTVIRGAAPECDLLIQIREVSSGTSVKLNCAARQVSSVQAGSDVVVIRQDGSGSRNSGSGHHLKSAEEIKRYNEERGREIKAKREAFERQATARMQQYDEPVYPQSQPRSAPAKPAIPSAPIAHYRDDAPALAWPAWLVSVNGEHLSPPSESARGPESSLSRKYQTTAAMTEVERFYKERLSSNGFTIRKSGISTGSTSAGVKQNASGEVEGYRAEGSGINPPATTIKVSFSRMYLNEPITVWMNVSVRGSFGR